MQKVLVIGATGQTGFNISKRLVKQGVTTLGLHRKTEQASFLKAAGLTPLEGDLVNITVERLTMLMHGVDTIIFAAGNSSGSNALAEAVDYEGLVKTAMAAMEVGVKRLLLVSAFPEAWRDQNMSTSFEHYMSVKKRAEAYLVNTPLDWIIIRPGTLTNDQGLGYVNLGVSILYGKVSRDDLSQVIVELVYHRNIRRVILELTSGEMSISDAVKNIENTAQ